MILIYSRRNASPSFLRTDDASALSTRSSRRTGGEFAAMLLVIVVRHGGASWCSVMVVSHSGEFAAMLRVILLESTRLIYFFISKNVTDDKKKE